MTPKPTNPQDKDKVIEHKVALILQRLYLGSDFIDKPELGAPLNYPVIERATHEITQLLAQPSVVLPEKVDRFEVIDNEGRAYVKGSIYGSPVSIELSYQDEGRTLKVFVKALNNKKGS